MFSRLAGLAACAVVATATLGAAAQARPQTPLVPQAQHRVVVAIVDTGVSPSKQLKGRLLPGFDFVGNDANAADLNGHGTIMAGIVAAQCPRCLILPVRVLGSSGLGSAELAVKGIAWAVAHGANVINLSMNTPSDNPSLSAAIEAAVAAGVTTVVAAGNSGQDVGYPAATSPDAISVASADATGRLYSWSNFGPWVTVVAPGTIPARSLSGAEISATGTSASAALVSGAAGLLLSCRSLSPAAVSAQLRQSLTSSC